jgi:sugar phosphate isomerase/epimerase
MNLLFFCPMWGMGHLPQEEMLVKIKNAGYDGIEFSFPVGAEQEKKTFLALTKELGLLTIAQQCYAEGHDFKSYRARFETNLQWLVSFEPLLINSHTGRDFYPQGQNESLIGIAAGITQQTGVEILHETHRGRFAFWPAQCLHYLNRYPDLKLTADFSHFCAVSESLLEDQPDAMDTIVSSCYHVHARVGHPQGPQVTDPRLPVWQQALAAHLAWWDRIVALRRHDSDKLTITPEFGPAPYMLSFPDTGVPLASQWELNLYMMQLLKTRYILN